jgi:hypothetical protein
MDATTKHTLDVLAFFSGIAVWLKTFTDILGFFVALAGCIWWGLRFYAWYKEQKTKEK